MPLCYTKHSLGSAQLFNPFILKDQTMNPKIAALVAAARQAHAERLAKLAPQKSAEGAPAPGYTLPLVLSNISNISNISAGTGVTNAGMAFNPEQLQAIEHGLQGKSFCLIGAAGTGKTTVTQELISRLQRASHMVPLSAATKHLGKDAPAIAIVGYTNKAVNNIRKRLPEHLQNHCLTIHKLIEFAPVYYEIVDADGNLRTTMRFEPTFNEANKLPHISTLIIEESSMVGLDLYGQLIAALPKPNLTQIIFLGDLNQIPPVFGPSILGFKLAELPVVELTHVYRQALLSPIISLATSIRTGAVSDIPELRAAHTIDCGEHGTVHFQPWKKRADKESALLMMHKFIPGLIEQNKLNPESDMILMPFNKEGSFGTIEINRIIADFLGKRRGAEVHEVIARYQKTYWAVGDRVMVDRYEAQILDISPTIGYYGKEPQLSSKTLNRWGFNPETPDVKPQTADEILNALDNLAAGDEEESKNLASHNIKVYIPDLGVEKVLTSAGEINQMTFGYALSIHKSQGSEWDRVFILLHNSHASMIFRELMYTAVTRAKKEVFIITEGDIAPYENSLKVAASRPRIPGTKLKEKIAYFERKAKELMNPAVGRGVANGAESE